MGRFKISFFIELFNFNIIFEFSDENWLGNTPNTPLVLYVIQNIPNQMSLETINNNPSTYVTKKSFYILFYQSKLCFELIIVKSSFLTISRLGSGKMLWTRRVWGIMPPPPVL